MESQRSKPTDDIQEPKRDTSQPKDAYRAPRLVTCGTAVGLVQGGALGQSYDGRGWLYRP
jgi:hypothetical protein